MDQPIVFLTAVILIGAVIGPWLYVLWRSRQPDFREPLPPTEGRVTSGWMYQDDPPLS